MNLAIIGATGLVGREIIKVIEELNLDITNCYLSASENSVGKTLKVKGETLKVLKIDDVLKEKIDIAIFSAGTEVSKYYAPKFVEKNAFVIDNSSQWRLYEKVPLVVPEINSHLISEETKLIANPNCSTIQLVLVLYPLHKTYKIRRIVISTYQSVSGSGYKAIEQLMAERNGLSNYTKFYPHKIDMNCIPFAGSLTENKYSTEEMKLINETKKILNDYSLKITSTVVRIPIINCHSESVNIEFFNTYELNDIYNILKNSPGIVLIDEPENNFYPMPIIAAGRNEVFVGRIRRDFSIENGLNLWIVADNLRKGAATNAVQIALYIKNKFNL